MQGRWIGSFILGVGLFFSGCSIPFMGNTTDKAPTIEGSEKRTPASRIVVSEVDILDRPYTILGDVNASDSAMMPFSKIDKADVVIKLREVAAKMGADAVVFTRYTYHERTWKSGDSIEAKGKAVKFTRY